jgi:hypothetical protein
VGGRVTVTDHANPERSGALARIVELADTHRIALEDIAAALAARRGGEMRDAGGKAAILTRLLAYLGGVFVFAGLGIFIATQWEEMNSAARVVVTLGSGLAAFAMAFIATKDERFGAAATPLNLIAAILQPLGILVALDEYSTGGDWHYASLLAAGVLLAQQLLVFYATSRTALLFNALVFGAIFTATLLDLLGVADYVIALTVGASLLCLAVGIHKTRHAAITVFWYAFATALALWGLFDGVQGTSVEVLFLGAACGMVYLSTAVRSRSVLVVATVAILGYIGYYTEEHFVDVAGWPLALMAFGFVMLALSAVAVTINRRYIRSTSR